MFRFKQRFHELAPSLQTTRRRRAVCNDAKAMHAGHSFAQTEAEIHQMLKQKITFDEVLGLLFTYLILKYVCLLEIMIDRN